MPQIELAPGQVWENVKHSPLRGHMSPALPELVDLTIVRTWHEGTEDPLWVVSIKNPPKPGLARLLGPAYWGEELHYFERESVIRAGTLKR